MNAKNDTKNFLNFHVLISHSPSCLNRDDMNMQKTAVFGGVKRVRISSQSLKRAMRKSHYYRDSFGKPSFRTRKLQRAKEELIRELSEEFDRSIVEEAAIRFVSENEGQAKEDLDGGADGLGSGDQDESKKLAVAPWVVGEIKEISRIIKEIRGDGLSEEETQKALKSVGKTVGKGKEKRVLTEEECSSVAMDKKILQKVKESVVALRTAVGTAVDVALSGRMATSGLMLPVDGSLAVAHAITTHAVEPQDVDWFTAVDDLTQEAGETGAGHLNTQEFSAGVFYRYASLNLKQLQVNLGLLDGMESEETPDSRKRALEIAKHVFHMLATVVPTAKRQPFAADNLADFAIVSFSEMPVSLANAFERPVDRAKGGGYLVPSEISLTSYWERLNRAYDLSEKAAAFRFDDTPWKEKGVAWSDKLHAYGSLSNLEAWVENDGNVKK